MKSSSIALGLVVAFGESIGLASSNSINFGPSGCVSLSRSAAGTCVFATDCNDADVSKFEFAFDCEQQRHITRHSYGVGGFDADEEFDTEIACQKCLPPKPKVSPHSSHKPKSLKKKHQANDDGHLKFLGKSGKKKRLRKKKRAPEARVAPVVMAAREGDDDAEKDNGKDDKEKNEGKEKAEDQNQTQEVDPPSKITKYGPKKCISTYRSEEGHCMMETKCEAADIKNYEFGLVCVDQSATPVRHLFGKDSFDPEETFDTLIICNKCLGLEDSAADSGLAEEVNVMAEEMTEMKDMMKNITSSIEKLNAEVFKNNSSNSSSDNSTNATNATAAPAMFLRSKHSQRSGKHHRRKVGRKGLSHNSRREHQHEAGHSRHRRTVKSTEDDTEESNEDELAVTAHKSHHREDDDDDSQETQEAETEADESQQDEDDSVSEIQTAKAQQDETSDSTDSTGEDDAETSDDGEDTD